MTCQRTGCKRAARVGWTLCDHHAVEVLYSHLGPDGQPRAVQVRRMGLGRDPSDEDIASFLSALKGVALLPEISESELRLLDGNR